MNTEYQHPKALLREVKEVNVYGFAYKYNQTVSKKKRIHLYAMQEKPNP